MRFKLVSAHILCREESPHPSSTAIGYWGVVIYTSNMPSMHCTCVFMPPEGPTGRNFEPHPPFTPSHTMQQGLYGDGPPKRDVANKSWFWAMYLKWGWPTELWDRCLTDSALRKSRNRPFRNTTQLSLSSKSHGGSKGRVQHIKKCGHIRPLSWIAVNSYPAISVLAGTTFERIEPPRTNFIALVEVVPDGISTHFQVVTLQGEREFVNFWYCTRILSCS